MDISSKDLVKVALLAKLQMTESELQVVSTKLLNVLDFVAQLANVDTSDVEEMAHPVEIHTVTREDSAEPSLPRESALQNSPDSDGQFFLVPPVLG